MNKLLLFFFLFLLTSGSQAQDKYWFFLSEKSSRDTQKTYVSTKCLANRALMGLPLEQQSDLPPLVDHVNEIKLYGKVRVISKWLNAVSVECNPEEYNLISLT